MNDSMNRRILLIDDTESIHADFKKILCPAAEAKGDASLDAAKAAFFGDDDPIAGPLGDSTEFELDSALQGKEGLEKLRAAMSEGRPYAMAFVDMRMPPGWDGIQTIQRLWEVDQDLQVVICTAYSDYSWDQTVEKLGQSDRLLILKKPFDSVEISQLASALTEKWNVSRRNRDLIQELSSAEQKARAYASSLETVNRALMTSKASADKSSQMKTDFLEHISGEIHGNLGRIIESLAGLHGQSPDTAEARRTLEIVDSSTKLMETFDALLDLTLLEAGRAKPEIDSCDLMDTLQSVVDACSPKAEAKGLALALEVPSRIPQSIQTDSERLRQVLRQLLDNAVRYTSEGSVRLVVRTENTDDWKSTLLRCDVIDTGPGIPSARQGNLFEASFQPRSQERSSGQGAGLGLALCKQIARQLGGDLLVETVDGEGSTFRLTLDAGDLSGVAMLEGGQALAD